MKRIVLTLTVLIGAATMLLAQPVDPRRLITVEGEAEALVAPDRASVVIGVETEGADVMVIKTENDKRVKAMFAALKTAGIAEQDIQTSDLQIAPQYNWKEGKREFVKYVMRNVVYINVRDLSKVEKVINASVSGGVNLLEHVNFKSSNAKAIRDSLRIVAAQDGRKKADDLATALGAKVGKLMAVDEQGGNQQPVPMYRSDVQMMKASEDSSTPVSAGQLAIRVTLSLKFGIE